MREGFYALHYGCPYNAIQLLIKLVLARVYSDTQPLYILPLPITCKWFWFGILFRFQFQRKGSQCLGFVVWDLGGFGVDSIFGVILPQREVGLLQYNTHKAMNRSRTCVLFVNRLFNSSQLHTCLYAILSLKVREFTYRKYYGTNSSALREWGLSNFFFRGCGLLIYFTDQSKKTFYSKNSFQSSTLVNRLKSQRPSRRENSWYCIITACDVSNNRISALLRSYGGTGLQGGRLRLL